jgi:dTDP-glucose 4,6-dehydratase
MRALIEEGDVVFHLAALIGIPYSYQAVRSYLDTNVGGTLNVLEAGRRGARRVLVMSTSEVYGSAIRTPIPEDHPLQAQSPYAASKIAAEKLAESYHRSFALPVTVVRPFNTYGPRQSARAVIPTILMQALAGKPDIQLGDASTTRDFNFVPDTVEGLVKLAECEAAVGRVVNVGSGSENSIARVVELAAALAGRTMVIREDPARLRPATSEVRRLCADPSLLRTLTGWAPPDRLQDGLRLTAEWMRSRADSYQADRYYV